MLRKILLSLVTLAITSAIVLADKLPTIESFTKDKGFEKLEGFFNLHWDPETAEIWLEIPDTNQPFLYVTSTPAGLGSNDIGIDRGQLGGEYVVHFERVGTKILLVRPNLDYRAITDNELERKSVKDAFAEGIVWGFKAEASTGPRVLFNATKFLLRDVVNVTGRLKQRGQGSFSLDESRSVIHKEMTKSFPDNTEMEVRLTFKSADPGALVRSVAADPNAVTLRQRQSFVRLPDDGYTPRLHDPRSGYGTTSFMDYSSEIGDEMTVRYINRHRLQKKDPNAEMSEAVEPIIYYLDPGTPEPVRSALLEGGRWWNEAYEAAGFIDAFRVEMLPEGADMMDVRYNVIQWVHRSTRGWSYGSSVSDPRTGEIIKGHVSLGSLRVRQDYLIAEGLLSPYDRPMSGTDPMLEMSLARIRQLSAHEIGHTIGLSHNFASSFNDRASVMDYPAMYAEMKNGRVSLDEAYDTGIGEWDKIAIRYGYTEFADPAAEVAGLADILAEADARNLYFITDTDARPLGGAHPRGHLWDNKTDAVSGLENNLAVREYALGRLGMNSIREGRPMAQLEEVLVPLYLRHRYSVEAVAKMIAGVDYKYALKGGAGSEVRPVSADEQNKALEALLRTVKPELLAIPDQVRKLLPPRPPGYRPTRELFDGHTGLVFDEYAPAETVARLVLGVVVHPQRAARLMYQKDHKSDLPGLQEVLDTVSRAVVEGRPSDDAYAAELQRLVQAIWVETLQDLAHSSSAAPGVRSRVMNHLSGLRGWFEDQPGRGRETMAHREAMAANIESFMGRDFDPEARPGSVTTPPGSPIGSLDLPLMRYLDDLELSCGVDF